VVSAVAIGGITGIGRLYARQAFRSEGGARQLASAKENWKRWSLEAEPTRRSKAWWQCWSRGPAWLLAATGFSTRDV
jgi:hypothetical protein